jgi:hypothetical protein
VKALEAVTPRVASITKWKEALRLHFTREYGATLRQPAHKPGEDRRSPDDASEVMSPGNRNGGAMTSTAAGVRDRFRAMAIRPGVVKPRSNDLLVLLLLIGLSAMGGGCSWLFTQPLPARYDARYDIPPCSTNRAPPVLDTLFALTNLASAVYVAGQSNVTNKDSAVSLGLSVATLWTLSAVYGYRHTSECEEAHAGPWTGYTPGNMPGPRLYRRPVPRPAETTAADQTVRRPEGAPAAGAAAVVPAQPPTPTTPSAPQQEDDDDPSVYHPPRPRPRASPLEPRPPDDPRFGG